MSTSMAMDGTRGGTKISREQAIGRKDQIIDKGKG